MDDLDKFLEEETGTTAPSNTTPAVTSIEKDDDFLAFLDAPVTVTPARTGDLKERSLSLTKAIEDSEDFLDWLQDSPRKNSATTAPEEVQSPWSPNASFIETSKHMHIDQKDISKESMDSFFNDVFGSPSPSAKIRKEVAAGGEEAAEDLSLEERVSEIVRSSFPDIQLLKKIICEAGYVPSAQRAQVWSLVLAESCVEDEEARHYSAEGVDFEAHHALVSDCAAVIAAAGAQLGTPAQVESTRRDMQDILVLYCQRRNIAYGAVLSRLLSPLLAVPDRASRTLASSCFYTVASTFAPLINLNPVAYHLGVGVTHSWLRALLSYHSPALALHLDRVLPHWQEAAAEISAHQSAQIVAAHKRNNELDELERELGLDVLDEEVSATAAARSDRGASEAIESAMPVREAAGRSAQHSRTNSGAGGLGGGSGHGGQSGAGRGCVPSHWIVGLFTGSLPPAQAAMVLDWAILSGCPFAGLYFSVALLKIYSHSLLKLTGPRIRQWFEEVGMNKADWYRNMSVSVPDGVEKSVGSTEIKFIPDSWTAFTKGWIHCTAALIRSTPQAFKDAVNNTPEWAQLKSEQRAARVRSNGSTHSMDAASHGRSAEQLQEGIASAAEHGGNREDADGGTDNGADSGDEYAEDNIFDSPDERNRARQQGEGSGTAAQALSGKGNFMAQFRRLSLHFQNDNAAAQSPVKSPFAKLLTYPHEKVHAGHHGAPLCLSASVEEVIPCICSNRKRAVAPEDLVLCFYSTAFNPVQDGIPVVFPASSLENSVFYFGIDCRSVQERALGQFPKAYAFDPAGLADGDEVTRLMDMVETMAASAHLCLIGAGEDFLRWSFEQANPRRSGKHGRGDPPELTRSIEEGAAKLNAVAMFFLKRSFKHVSILDGGFSAAAKYLHQPNSPLSLTAALVDCNRAALESMLGIHPTISAAPPAKRESIVSYLAESTVGAPSKLLSVGNYFGMAGSSGAPARSTSPVPAPHAPAPTAVSAPAAAPAAAPVSAAAPVASAAAPKEDERPVAEAESGTKQLLSSWGKKLTMFSTSSLETIKKSVASVSVAAATAGTVPITSEGSAPPTTASGADEYEDDGMGPKELPDTTGITISRTDKEREQALSLHKMAGLRKGDKVMINRQDLPGAILFPSIKYKEVMVDAPVPTPPPSAEGATEPSAAPTAKVAQLLQVHRYLVVSRERFIVLDAAGGGVGSAATVKSNRHLTELMKMTFKKKDPELVTLFFVAPDLPLGKPRQYRVSKRQEFVSALQKNMERFK